jgi:hypothetical protein
MSSRFSVNAPPNILGINTSNTFSSIQQNVIQGNTTLDKIAYQNFTFTGIKTFSVPPVCAVAPTSNTQLVNKLYVDSNSASAWSTFPATSNVSIGQYTMNFVITGSPNHFVRLNRNQITVQNSPLHVHLTPSGITCTNTTTAQNAVLDCSSLTFTGSAGSQIVFSDSTVQTTAFTNAMNTNIITLQTKTTDISYSSSTTTIDNGVRFPSLLSTMPTTNTGSQYGLSLYWNKSGGLGEVDYLAMGQGAGNISGHAFYCSNASNAPVLCLTLTPTSLLIPSDVVTTFNGNISANSQTITPTQLGYISGLLSNAQTQINAIATTTELKANLDSPTFTGTPAGPTATAGTSTTQLATTAFVTAVDVLKANIVSPTFTGTPAGPTASAGTSTGQLATTGFVMTAVNLKANIASPTFTGTPAGPTPSPGTNTTQLATTAFVTSVDVLKANIASPTLTGILTVPTITNTLAFAQNPNKSFVVANTNLGLVGMFSGMGNNYPSPYFSNTFGSVTTNCEVIIGNNASNHGSFITFRCYQAGTGTFTITCSGTNIFLYDNTSVTSLVLSYATNPCATLVSLVSGGWYLVNTGVDTLKGNLSGGNTFSGNQIMNNNLSVLGLITTNSTTLPPFTSNPNAIGYNNTLLDTVSQAMSNTIIYTSAALTVNIGIYMMSAQIQIQNTGGVASQAQLNTNFILNGNGIDYTNNSVVFSSYPLNTTNHMIGSWVLPVSSNSSNVTVNYSMSWVTGTPTIAKNQVIIRIVRIA